MSGRPVTRPRPGHSLGHGLGLGPSPRPGHSLGHGLGLGPSPRYESRF